MLGKSKKGILPSQIKEIYKTWHKKDRVFHENNMFELIFTYVYITSLFMISSLSKLIVESCERMASGVRIPYLVIGASLAKYGNT